MRVDLSALLFCLAHEMGCRRIVDVLAFEACALAISLSRSTQTFATGPGLVWYHGSGSCMAMAEDGTGNGLHTLSITSQEHATGGRYVAILDGVDAEAEMTFSRAEQN